MSEAAVAEVDSGTSNQPSGASARHVGAAPMGAGARDRSVPVRLGEYEYTARVPKLIVWQGLAELLQEQHGNRASRRAAAAGRAEVAVSVDRVRLTSALSHFLRGCLSRMDWSHVEAQLDDGDADLDIPDLWAAGLLLVAEFEPDMRRMAEAIGMKMPEQISALVESATKPANAKAAKAPAKRAAKAQRGQ